MLSSDLIIVIPCYNEEKRLKNNTFKSFLETTNNVKIIFSNDGSTDNTLKVLQDIKSQSNLQVIIHNMKKNSGKAQAVREGVLFAYTNNLKFNKIAYLDADLSTSLSECHLLRLLVYANKTPSLTA
jgi:glycosyltransferase involved in cell wall biosynthesis